MRDGVRVPESESFRGGASDLWTPADTQHLAGANVAIFFDNDEPGIDLGFDTCARVQPVSQMCDLVPLGREQGSDVSDYVEVLLASDWSLQEIREDLDERVGRAVYR